LPKLDLPSPTAKVDPADPRVVSQQRLLEGLQIALRESRDQFVRLHDEIHGVSVRCAGVERRFEALEDAMRQRVGTGTDDPGAGVRDAIAQLRLELDQRLLGLTPKMRADAGEYAPLAVVKQISVNFKTAIDGLDLEVAGVKEFLRNLVSRNELDAALEALGPRVEPAPHGETAGGRLSCLLCGQAVAAVTGMITEREVARMLGAPPQCSAMMAKEGCVLAFGADALRPKKRPLRKVSLPTVNPSVSFDSLATQL
jgi:hypothetical protein